MSIFLQSTVLGLAVAAPIGPIGLLCIHRALRQGFLAGLAGGVGTALADGVYAALAATGFSAFAAALDSAARPMTMAGGLFMLWLGLRCLKERSDPADPLAAPPSAWKTTVTTFVLTVANPITILTFAAMFAGLGLTHSAQPSSALPMIAGVLCGTLLWWCLLSGGVALLRRRLPASFATWVSRIAGTVILGFGAVAVISPLLR